MTDKKNDPLALDTAKKRIIGLTDAQISYLKEIYSNVDVDQEIKKMAFWLMIPENLQKNVGIGFMLNWLNNATNKPIKQKAFLDLLQADTPLRPVLMDYLKELWKGKEKLLEFNTISKQA
jgi:hypothetical protein